MPREFPAPKPDWELAVPALVGPPSRYGSSRRMVVELAGALAAGRLGRGFGLAEVALEVEVASIPVAEQHAKVGGQSRASPAAAAPWAVETVVVASQEER